MPRMSSRHGAGHLKDKTRSVLLYSMAGVLVLGLCYVASRTLPFFTPAFGEWAYRVVSRDGEIQRFLSTEARRQVELPSAAQRVDEDTNLHFGPLVEAFEEADTSPKGPWPTRIHEVSVSIGGEKKVIAYHCVIEWFSWRVADIYDNTVGEA